MAESRRSSDQSGIIIKNRSSSGCLIVRKKSEDVSVAGSSGTRKVFESKKEKKRSRSVMSDSGSSDELLMPPRRKMGAETIRVCNGLGVLEKGVVEESEFGRKRDRNRVERVRHNEDGLIGRNDGHNSDRKRNRLDVFEFDEYDGIDGEMMRRRKHLEDSRVDIGGRRFFGSMGLGRSGIDREFDTGMSRHVVDKRKNLYLERTSSFNQGGMNRFGMDRDAGRVPISLLREKYMGDPDEPIRLQGKNGVLKVMVNKKKKMGEPVKKYDRLDAEENRNSSRDNKRNVPLHPPSYLETEALEKPCSFVRAEKNQINLKKSVSAKKSKVDISDSDDSDTALKLGSKKMEARKSIKEVSSESEKTPGGKLTLTGSKEGKVRRGSGTEKQKLRERIRSMLVEAGWTIDYRPRRNRDYLDAVYISPSGTAYWSIIKAYDALLKQNEEDEAKLAAEGSPFTPLSDEVLSQLTRKTRKKIEKEMKKKQKDVSQSVNTREAAAKKLSSARHDEESMDSISHEEKLSSFLKQGGKSSKSRMNENGVVSQNSKGQSSNRHLHDGDEKPASTSNSHMLHGRKSKKHGRCTLLVRGSNEGSNSETDGFVPYSGKRTLLSWLIDSGTVQLSEKVQYMNRRRTKVMLEGWITRDGIHCGCCSKILTVSKFEIHAGSKLRQPFQNIYLDSGISLLQCQIDAWNRQEESEHIGFDCVDIDGDDPNDDTCGICGDGGDLICCDGCPSTFHQSCLDIQMLPAGDWHCPNCTCKFCGSAGNDTDDGGDVAASGLLNCSMCEKKYHKLCMREKDAIPVNSNSSNDSFCGQKCRELFEHLQKYVGVKHELEAGFSWSLIHRTDEDSDTMLRGLPQRVECNSKLAVALTVMDECFLPIVDRRSGVNLIHNVLYNSGSNFNRLNYNGFYTAILERGDEIISAASIRFHGTRLAEMPFIGTRHIYRRQGMCRRLFCALESALCSLKVEKLIIPAIAELMHTWTGVFGFTPLEEPFKREMRSLNMLVFPGIDMLQKLLLEQESSKENMKVANQIQLKAEPGVTSEVANKSNTDSSAEHDTDKFSNSDLLHASANDGVAAFDFDSKCPGDSSDGTSMPCGSLDASTHNSVEGTLCPDFRSADKVAESASDGKGLDSSTSHGALEMEHELEQNSPVADITRSSEEGDMDVVHEIDVDVSASQDVQIPVSTEKTLSSDSQSRDKLADSASVMNCFSTAGMSQGEPEKGDKPELNPPVSNKTQFSAESELEDAPAVAVNVAASHEVKLAVSVEEIVPTDSQLGENSVESASERNSLSAPGANNNVIDKEKNLVSDSPHEDNLLTCKEGDKDGICSVNFKVASSHAVEIPVSVERNVTIDSQSEENLVKSYFDKSVVYNKSHDMLEVESKQVSDSSVKDHAHSCKEVNTVDASVIDVNIAASHEDMLQALVKGSTSADFRSGDKVIDSACGRKCLSIPGTSDEALDKQKRHVLDNSAEDVTWLCRDDEMDDACMVDNNITSCQTREKSVESASKTEFLISETSHDELQIKQKAAVDSSEDNFHSCNEGNSDDDVARTISASCVGGTTVEKESEAINGIPVDVNSSMQVKWEEGHKLHVSSECGSEAVVSEESGLQSCSDIVRNAVSEGKTESSSA